MNKEVAPRIELALLEPLATSAEYEALCGRAHENQYHAITVPSSRVAQVYHFIGESDLRINCLVGFPFGAPDADVKRFETEVAVDSGAHEIEVVMNLARFKEKDYARVLRELRDVAEAAEELPVKVIIEAPMLDDAELREACRLVMDSGARFVTTTTGVHQPNAHAKEIARIRELVGPDFGIKAGGLNDFEDAENLAAIGANRLGNVGLKDLRFG